MGFGDSLWGQFDIVKQNCNTGEKRIKAVKQLLKKTQKEEASYADTASKASAALVVCGGQSLSSVSESLRSKLQEEHTSRSQFATRLEEEVQKLNMYTKTYLKTSHHLSQKTSKDQSHYDSKLAHLNKTKNHYYTCCKNEEQLQEALTNPNLEPKKQESLNQQLEKAKENKSQAQDQYSLEVNEHDKVYDEYVLACRDTLSQYEQLEKALCETLEAALVLYTDQRTELATSLSSYSSSMTDSVKTITVDSDLTSFVDMNSKHLEPTTAPQYEEFQSGATKGSKQHRKTILFKPKLGASKKKKGKKGESDDELLSPRSSIRDSSSSLSTSSDGGATPTHDEGSEFSSSPLTPAAMSRAPAPSPPGRADSGPPPAPPSREDSDSPVPPPPTRAESAPAPPSRGDSGPPPPSRSASEFAGPPFPSRADAAPAPAPPSRADAAPAPAPPTRGGSGPPTPSRGGSGPPTPTRGDSGPPPTPTRGDSGPPPTPTRGTSTSSIADTEVKSANWKIAVALYANEGEENELKLEEGTALFVINEDPTGWWLGATGSSVGFFPGSYIQYLDDDEQIGCVRAKALQDFTGDYDGDLSLSSGEVVTVTDYKDSWFTGVKKNGESGIFPCQYVQLLTDD